MTLHAVTYLLFVQAGNVLICSMHRVWIPSIYRDNLCGQCTFSRQPASFLHLPKEENSSQNSSASIASLSEMVQLPQQFTQTSLPACCGVTLPGQKHKYICTHTHPPTPMHICIIPPPSPPPPPPPPPSPPPYSHTWYKTQSGVYRMHCFAVSVTT